MVQSADRYQLRLYVAGETPKSQAALRNLRKLCEEHFPGRYELEIVDLILNPKAAREEQILAIPTLVRNRPSPPARLIGDLSDTQKVLAGLELGVNPFPAAAA